MADYLRGAELQKETNQQRAEIHRALRDMLHDDSGDPGWLRRRRYADYQGRENQWSIVTLIRKYFVPSHPMALDEESFYREVGTSETQAAVRERIHQLINAPSVGNWTCPDPVHVTETMDVPAGWESLPPQSARGPESITLFDQHPSKQTSLKPDNGDEPSDFYYWSGLDFKGGYWMSCSYGSGVTALAKSLPSGFTYCEESHEDDAVRLACYPGP